MRLFLEYKKFKQIKDFFYKNNKIWKIIGFNLGFLLVVKDFYEMRLFLRLNSFNKMNFNYFI